jgi:zinc finger HIT domain-containing protein 1
MATGPLRFRTPHIEELPTTQIRQAPGFAWVAVAAPPQDPSKNWGTTNRKRARGSAGGQTDSQREALSARQQKDIEKKIRELNSDNSKDVQIPLPKKEGGGGARAGKTPNTKKILASGKTFAHYLDDEEAEIARTGRRDGEVEVLPSAIQQQRYSKTPIARRKAQEDSSASGSPAPPLSAPLYGQSNEAMDVDEGDNEDDIVPLPSQAEIEALLNAPPLTYNQARSAPPPPDVPPPRRFCEVCGYFGRAKCMKCGAMTCSVMCKDTHDEQRCLKFYA